MNHVLTDNQIKEVLTNPNGLTRKDLADFHGVNLSTIDRIRNAEFKRYREIAKEIGYLPRMKDKRDCSPRILKHLEIGEPLTMTQISHALNISKLVTGVKLDRLLAQGKIKTLMIDGNVHYAAAPKFGVGQVMQTLAACKDLAEEWQKKSRCGSVAG